MTSPAARDARQPARAVPGQRRRRCCSRARRRRLRDRRHQDVRRSARRGAAVGDRRQAPVRQGDRGRAARRRDRPGGAQQQGHAGGAAGRPDDRRRAAARGSARRARPAVPDGGARRLTSSRWRVWDRRRASARAACAASRSWTALLPGATVRADSRQPRHAAAQARLRATMTRWCSPPPACAASSTRDRISAPLPVEPAFRRQARASWPSRFARTTRRVRARGAHDRRRDARRGARGRTRGGRRGWAAAARCRSARTRRVERRDDCADGRRDRARRQPRGAREPRHGRCTSAEAVGRAGGASAARRRRRRHPRATHSGAADRYERLQP